MARRQRVLKRPTISPDKTYNSELVTRLINRVMWDGKKTTAKKIVESALLIASDELQVAPLEALEKALDNVRPLLEIKALRVGGSNYQVPMEPYPARAMRLSLTWLVDSARSKKGAAMSDKLANIIVLSFKGEGPAVDKKNTVHQMAAANKAYAHLAVRAKKKK
jgi:small subunit ribosomal protein S7